MADVPDTPATELLCPRCGYDVRGLDSDRCPECGLPLDDVRAARSAIPWVYARATGRRRAYGRTVAFVTFHPIRLARDPAAVLDYADAQRFRLRTAALLYVGFLGLTAALIDANPGTWQQMLTDGVWIYIMLAVGGFFGLLGLTGVPTYLFHPRRLTVPAQNRAIALAYYACAPLVWSGVLALLVGAWVLISDRGGLPFAPPLWLGAALVALPFVWWWVVLIQLADATLRTRGRTLAVGLLTPLLALLILGLCVVVIPAMIFYIVAIFYALSH